MAAVEAENSKGVKWPPLFTLVETILTSANATASTAYAQQHASSPRMRLLWRIGVPKWWARAYRSEADSAESHPDVSLTPAAGRRLGLGNEHSAPSAGPCPLLVQPSGIGVGPVTRTSI